MTLQSWPWFLFLRWTVVVEKSELHYCRFHLCSETSLPFGWFRSRDKKYLAVGFHVKLGREWPFLDDMVIGHCAITKSLSSGFTSPHVREPLRDAIYYALHLASLG